MQESPFIIKKGMLSILLLAVVSLPLLSQSRFWHLYYEDAGTWPSTDVRFGLFMDSVGRLRIDSVIVCGYASPKGRYELNRFLAHERARVMAEILAERFPHASVRYSGRDEDWDMLLALLERSSLSAMEKDAVRSLSSLPAGKRSRALKRIRGGRVYRLLDKELFPLLRRIDISIYFHPVPERRELVSGRVLYPPPASAPGLSTGPRQVASAREDVAGSYVFALRSNLLFPLTNIGAVFSVGSHLTLGADLYSPWFWHDGGNRRCVELQFALVEVRYWLRTHGSGEHPFTGHSVGLGVFGGHYDFEWNYDGFQGEAFGGYLDYAYTIPLGERLRLEFSLGLGYARLPWRGYHVYTDGGKLLRPYPPMENFRDWLGPMKLGISLMMPVRVGRKRSYHE